MTSRHRNTCVAVARILATAIPLVAAVGCGGGDDGSSESGGGAGSSATGGTGSTGGTAGAGGTGGSGGQTGGNGGTGGTAGTGGTGGDGGTGGTGGAVNCGDLALAGPVQVSEDTTYVTINVPVQGTGEVAGITQVSFGVSVWDIKDKQGNLYPQWAPGYWYDTDGTITTDYDGLDTWAYFTGQADLSLESDNCSYSLAVPLDFQHVDQSCTTRSDCNNPFTDLCEAGSCVKPECLNDSSWGSFYTSCACRTLGGVGGVCAEAWCNGSALVNGSCSVDHICDDGTCVPPGSANVGETCDATMLDSGCEAGALCREGVCRWACLVGEPGPACDAGEVCNDSVCYPSSTFAEIGESCPADYEPCGPSGQALTGSCDSGVCTLVCEEHSDCASDEICNTFTNRCISTHCGNGTTESSHPYKEECDDSNQTSGDGCSQYCEKEGAITANCSSASTVVVGTQTVSLAGGMPAVTCSGWSGDITLNDYGATLRFVAPAIGHGFLSFAHNGTSDSDYPLVALLDGCPGPIDQCATNWGWYGPSWSGVYFNAKQPGEELYFAVRGREATGEVEVDFEAYSCGGALLAIGDTVLTGPDEDVLSTPSFSICNASTHRRLSYFIAEQTGEVVLTLKTPDVKLRVLEGCPAWDQEDLGCIEYTDGDALPASVRFPVVGGQRYSVITSDSNSSILTVTVHRAGP